MHSLDQASHPRRAIGREAAEAEDVGKRQCDGLVGHGTSWGRRVGGAASARLLRAPGEAAGGS